MKTSEYLKKRKIADTDYYQYAVSKEPVSEYKMIEVRPGMEFQVTVIFSDNQKYPLSIEQANINLGLQNGNDVAIGLLDGDEIVCLNCATGAVYFWLIENGDGEKIKIASSFTKFIELITVD